MEDGVIDTSVLVGFSGIGRLDVLWVVFPRLAIVPAVYREIVSQGSGWEDARAAQIAIAAGQHFILVTMPAEERASAGTSGQGETEVIGYALRHNLPALIDDGLARERARNSGVSNVVGTLGILARAKKAGYIKEVAPLVGQLRALGIRFGDDLIRTYLRTMNEQ